MKGKIHLVRHGKVENPKGVIYGRLPGYHLSELGKQQAQAAADRLAQADIGAVWSSPLERAQETAEMIAAPHSLSIITDERLLESGTSLEGIGRTLASFLTSPRHWWHLRNPFKPSWGESFSEIRARMLEVVAEALQEADGREVVVVSHQTPVQVARLALARRNVPPWLGFAPCVTGSVSTLELDEGRVLSASYFAPSMSSSAGSTG